ncbi:spore germination protein [Orenia marismortui]|uniref:Spore germination protein KA n=1 Tax=Orenia marismortui TaxID=46469 RepID=A0A4R8GRI0_9FIRM|nr:spore germination protein [Orenia marismortui]TDX48439.1 spore germination protein KA [Orenia marismortui]
MSKKIKRPLTIEEKKRKDEQEDLKALKKKYQKGIDINNVNLKSSLEENLTYIKGVFNKVSDLDIRRFILGDQLQLDSALVYIEGIVNQQFINDTILKELMIISRNQELKKLSRNQGLIELLPNSLLTIGVVEKVDNFGKIIENIFSGHVILLLDEYDLALSLPIPARESRNVKEPETETVVRGPREGFVENIDTNLSLIRARIKTPDLKLEAIKLGRVSKTAINIAYIEGTAPDDLIAEVQNRLKRIDIDMINESGIIEQLIEDDPFSPFPQIANTERPDGLAAALNEGRVGVIIDGTPFVLIVPSVFSHFLQSNEDYYQRFFFASFARLLRFFAFLTALLGPSIYIAITTFHQEMIPTKLLLSIVASRAGVPFPALVEALIMEISFEALREAGLRLPKQVGQAVSIVGALVVGQAAVEAGLVSQAMVIVVALTGIASFMIPAYNFALGVRLIRFGVMFLAASWGMFGITFAVLFLLIHLCSLRTFGVPYLSPFTPTDWDGLKDTIIKVPEWFKNNRPSYLVKTDQQRIRSNVKPSPAKGDDENE